jgi:hypothetical protein
LQQLYNRPITLRLGLKKPAGKFLLDMRQLAMLKKVYILGKLLLLKDNLMLLVVMFQKHQRLSDK